MEETARKMCIRDRDRLMSFPAEIYVPAHGHPSAEITEALKANKQRLQEVTELVLSILTEPLSREEIVAHFCREKSIDSSYSQYFLATAAITAHLTYLDEQGLIKPKVAAGVLKWHR